MTMVPYDGDIARALKWMHNNAPNIQSLITAKKAWYDQYNTKFWQNWETNVFDLRSANTFGLVIWCIILGVPTDLFSLEGLTNEWAYGANRQNFKWNSTINPGLANPNTVGGNFYGAGRTVLSSLQEVRYALMLRYAALVSNGQISYINRMLKNTFSPNAPWDWANKKYAYVRDCTWVATGSTPVPAALTLEYAIGSGLNLSDQFLDLLRTPQYGILPSCAGSKIIVTKE